MVTDFIFLCRLSDGGLCNAKILPERKIVSGWMGICEIARHG